MKKNLLFSSCLALLYLSSTNLLAESYSVKSPDKKLVFTFDFEDKNLSYSIEVDRKKTIVNTPISMTIDNKKYPQSSQQPTIKRSSVNKVFKLPVKNINSKITENYNEIILKFDNNIAVTARAYNEGVAFRWETMFNKNEILIGDEQNLVNFAKDFAIYYPQLNGRNFISHQENKYHYFKKLSKISPKLAKMRMPVPVLICLDNDKKMLISESDLESYPGWYWKKSDAKALQFSSEYPKYPLTFKQTSFRTVEPAKRANYIAKVAGSRTYPWRAFLIGNDKDLMVNQLIYKLASPSRIKDTSWIKPGKVQWDWWHAMYIKDVDFKSGINTQTYKHYIDFAAKHGNQYVILDEGWSLKGKENLLKVAPNMDIQEICDYGKNKGVGVILWTTGIALHHNFDKAFKQFAKWGVAGLKIDFLVRDDQIMVEWCYKFLKEAAKHKMVVDFHGAYKPTGFSRTYPNLLACESVLGLEQYKWKGKLANPKYDTIIPFIRNVVGPMDYTPGAMKNLHLKDYKINYREPFSIGTRCHQLAMYVVYYSGLQMLADSPTSYRLNPVAMQFLDRVPAEWDKSIALAGKTGEYAIMARKNNSTWFVGGLNNYDEREVVIKLNFLDDNKVYALNLYCDGDNIAKNAQDTKVVVKQVRKNDEIKVKMASGGGFAAVLSN
ncbi:glycoside hydrolase family 97 catalytic domain-containing protein [Lentisphaerota bacterium WC36G]|nr:glycoside hydrolase family 97 protein [Lentisphaerae bacterium WC36]